MRKPIIGVLAPNYYSNIRPFENYTKFIDNFSKRIVEAGGIPVGLLFPYGKFNFDGASLCDGFVIQGGADISLLGICLIHYAIKNNKPLLGICLGMQTMAAYEWVAGNLDDNFSYDDICNFYKDDSKVLKCHDGHNNVDPIYFNNIDLSKHEVIIDKESRIYKLYNKDIIYVPSLHNQVVIQNILHNKHFKVTGKSNDGVAEVLESVDPNLWILGTQFHPELEKENLILFKKLIDEALKRI